MTLNFARSWLELALKHARNIFLLDLTYEM